MLAKYRERTKKFRSRCLPPESGCGRINDTTRDGTICYTMGIKNARSKYGEPSRLIQMVDIANIANIIMAIIIFAMFLPNIHIWVK